MDIVLLAQNLTALLTPFLPYLLQAGQKVAQEAVQKFGAEAWETAKGLWQSLSPKVEAKPAASEAAQDLAHQPADQDVQAAFRRQLLKLLSEDETLAHALADRMSAINAREIRDSNIVTGDHNVVQQGKYNISMGNASGIVIGDQARGDAHARDDAAGQAPK